MDLSNIAVGRHRLIGSSSETSWGVMKSLWAADLHDVDRYETVQNNFSLINRRCESELAQVCRREGWNLLPYSPLGGGVLTGGRDVTTVIGEYRSGDNRSPDEVNSGSTNDVDDYSSWTAPESGTYYIGISSAANAHYSPLSENSTSVEDGADRMGDYRVTFLMGVASLPTISIASTNIAREQTIARFEVTLDYPATEVVTVDYVTVAGTVTSGDDFEMQSGTVTFEPGETNQVISITVADGQWVEATESFTVELSNPRDKKGKGVDIKTTPLPFFYSVPHTNRSGVFIREATNAFAIPKGNVIQIFPVGPNHIIN